MIDIDANTAVKGAAAGLTLLNNLVKLIQSAREKGSRLGIADITEKLPAEAFTLAGQFVQHVTTLRQSFLNAKIDPKKTIDELQAETGWWRYKRYKLVNNFKANINAICDQLGSFLDDVVSIAHCREAEDVVAHSFREAEDLKAKIRTETDYKMPIEDIFKHLLDHAEKLRAQLGDMIHAKA